MLTLVSAQTSKFQFSLILGTFFFEESSTKAHYLIHHEMEMLLLMQIVRKIHTDYILVQKYVKILTG